jgi:uncharacterized lipoprotein YmbA
MQRIRVAIVLGVLTLAGCASPEPTYYTLAAVPGPAAPGAPPRIEVQRPSIAGYLDRTAIVRRGTAYELSIAPGERWGEPFDEMIGRTLTQELTQRLTGSTVAYESALAGDEATVDLDVARFDADPEGRVTLLAQVTVRTRDHLAAARELRITVPAPPGATSGLVAAMSQALGELADRVAEMLRQTG